MTKSKSKHHGLKSWSKGYRVCSSVTDETIRRFLQALDCPRALTVWLLYENKEHEQLVNLETSLSQYEDVLSFRDAYSATELLSKADFLDLPFDRKQVALDKFFSKEEACRATNVRFRNLALDPKFSGPNVALLHAMQLKIAKILGSYDRVTGQWTSNFCPEEWFDSCSWGPGSTYGIRGRDTSAVNKFQCETGITPDLLALVGPLFDAGYPLWGSRVKAEFVSQPMNRVLTVPKNAKTDRVIAAEPGLNIFFQKGLGEMIRRRLLRAEGIDLKHQDRNGLLSFYGSMSGQLATIDFSAASDCISSQVVEELLPRDWFLILDSARSKFGDVDGGCIKWEKFSSMGNGFTFPLQSLLFLTAALAVCEYCEVDDKYVGVYGDDVILPVEAYSTFFSFCDFLGFSINPEKSHVSGFFRESCGYHYAKGYDVKPIYIKERLTGCFSVFKMANAIRRLARRHMLGLGCRRSLWDPWVHLYKLVPKKYRLIVCDGFGDGGFIGNFDEAAPHLERLRGQCEGFRVTSLQQSGVRYESEEFGLLLARLSAPSTTQAYYNWVGLRNVTTNKVIKFVVPRWEDLGAWV